MAWGAVAALWAMVVPAFVWGYFQYRQHHLVLGPVRLMWKARRASMVMLFVRALAWFALASMMVVGVAGCGVGWGTGFARRVSTQALFGVWLGVAWLVLAAVVPYLQARMQNLVWSKTGNRYLRFRSRLDVQAYVWLQLRHRGAGGFDLGALLALGCGGSPPHAHRGLQGGRVWKLTS